MPMIAANNVIMTNLQLRNRKSAAQFSFVCWLVVVVVVADVVSANSVELASDTLLLKRCIYCAVNSCKGDCITL